MPCLTIFTTLARNKIPDDFVYKIIPVLSKTVRKPETRFIVALTSDCLMSFGGQIMSKPGAVATLESIGNLGLEENKVITRAVTDFIEKELGIAPEQMSFYDLCGFNVGKGGKTLISA